MQFATTATLLTFVLAGLACGASAQQPGPFTAGDLEPYGPAQSQIQIPQHLYGPDLDGNTPSEVALSAGAVRARLQRLGFHSFSEIRFGGGYWNVVAMYGNKKRQLTVHPQSGALRSDRPYCNNRCNFYQLADEF